MDRPSGPEWFRSFAGIFILCYLIVDWTVIRINVNVLIMLTLKWRGKMGMEVWLIDLTIVVKFQGFL